LINKGQRKLLENYDFIIFGAFDRNKTDKWYPIGWLETKFILENYVPTKTRPDGGIYPFAGYPVKTSDLKSVESLIL
jgi:hypothetical protein